MQGALKSLIKCVSAMQFKRAMQKRDIPILLQLFKIGNEKLKNKLKKIFTTY